MVARDERLAFHARDLDDSGHDEEGGIARRVSAVAIANTETVVLNSSIAADLMVAGTTFRVTAFGRLTSGGTGGSSIFRLRIGTTTLTGNIPTSLTIVNANNATNAPFWLLAMATVRTAGAGGTIIGELQAWGGLTVPPFTLAGDVTATSGTVALDTTAVKLFELTYISGNAGTTATFEVVSIEIVNAQ